MCDHHVYIVAEAGVNHNGSLELAKRLIDIAKEAGADAVKFQTFSADSLVARSAVKARYQMETTDASESQYDMLRKLQLDRRAHEELVRHCEVRKIQFLSSPFDRESLRLLTEIGDVPFVKIPSGEITNGPLLLAAARTGRRIILSTGMCTLGDIEAALGVLVYGYMKSDECPTASSIREAYGSADGKRILIDQVILLHCTTQYPTPYEHVHLRAMDTLRSFFGVPVGLSDHTEGVAVAIAAAARGASVLEKHFTLDKKLPGPDHRASVEPDELKRMIAMVRQVELSLGSDVKQQLESERENALVARKSLVAACDICRGEYFTEENLAVKRPGTGISPMDYWDWLGSTATRDYAKDELVK